MIATEPTASDPRPKVAVCVVNYFSAHDVAEMLQSLAERSTNTRLLVSCIDNSTDRRELDLLERVLDPHGHKFEHLAIEASSRNLGYAGGNNLAWERLRDMEPAWVLTINPDVRIISGSLDALVAEASSSPPTLFGVHTNTRDTAYTGLGHLDVTTGRTGLVTSDAPGTVSEGSSIVYPGGHFLFADAFTWNKLSGFAEDFFLFYEEADLALRAELLNVGIRASQSIGISHLEGLTTGALRNPRRKSYTTNFHSARSAVIFYAKHRPALLWRAVVLRAIYAIGLGLTGNPRAPLAILPGLRSGMAWRTHALKGIRTGSSATNGQQT